MYIDDYPEPFPCKVTHEIDFTDEVVVQCDVTDVKVVLVIYKWLQIYFLLWILMGGLYAISHMTLGVDYMKIFILSTFEVIFEF